MVKRFQQISSFTVILALLAYISLALAAYAQYPGAYAPSRNWLSDLGDIQHNPQGAIFYNLGIVFAGLLLLLFFLGFSKWKMKSRKIQNLMVRLTQLFGVLGSLSMVMSAIYPITFLAQHRFWSISLYILLGTAIGFSVAALRYRPECPRRVLMAGVITAFVDILSGVFHEIYLLEWITVALFLVFLFILSMESRAVENARFS